MALRAPTVAALAGAVAVAGADDAHALVGPVSRADLARAADVVVVGDVIDTAVVDVDGALDLRSVHTVVVREVIDGGRASGVAAVISVSTAGGRQGEIVVAVEDEPVLTVGRTLVLFLARAGIDSDGGDFVVARAKTTTLWSPAAGRLRRRSARSPGFCS
jgi:hypothetical protein